MGTIRKRSKTYRAEVHKLGVRMSRTFDRKSEALAWIVDTERRIDSRQLEDPECISLGELLARYAREVSTTKRGRRWEETRASYLARDPIASKRVDRITTTDLAGWRDRRMSQVGAGTVLRDITLLMSVFEFARLELRLIRDNPLRDLRKPPAPRHRERLPTDAEIERICIALDYDPALPVHTCGQQVAVAFLLAIETAMRAGEMMSLTWDQVDLQRRVVRLEQTKNGDRRDVPLSSRAVELLESLHGLDPSRCFTVAEPTRDALFRRARDDAEAHGLTFHDSRALALTRLSQRLNILELARMVGHRDPKSLMVYYRESAEAIARKLD